MKVFTRQANDLLYEWSSQLSVPLPRTALKNTSADGYIHSILREDNGWICNMDEDVFLFSVSRLLELRTFMEREKIDYCGMRDGGVTPMRQHNPSVCNPFFNVFGTSRIAGKFDEKLVRAHRAPAVAKTFESPVFASPYEYNMAEPFYPVFLWLRMNFKCLFLKPFVFADGISTILHDHMDRPLLIHTWYAREYKKSPARYMQAREYAMEQLRKIETE
jgi:hypothetical protein